jgi:hypothetical protein
MGPVASKPATASSAVLYHAGPLGYILEVTAEGSKNTIPHVILISDRSGSMGSHSAMIVNQAIPDALQKLSLPLDTPVTVITFDSVSERVLVSGRDPTVTQLRTVAANDRGCTEMVGVVPILKQVFAEIPSEVPVSIMVISDGAVSDINATVRAISDVAETIKARPGPISASLYRLKTSNSSNPDTRALACIGQLTTSGSVPVVDIPFNNMIDLTHQFLVNQIIHDNQNKHGSSCEIKASGYFMRRMPADSPVDKLVIPGGVRTFIMIPPDSDISSITIDNKPIQISNVVELDTESQLTKLLEFIDGQLRMSMVAGANPAKLAENLKFIKDLDQYLCSKVSDVATGSVAIRDRVKSLISSTKKSLITSMLAMANLANLDNLAAWNSAQNADFLRKDLTSTSLANRAAKMYGGVNYDDKCREPIKTPITGSITMPGEEVSYFSQSGFSDILNGAKDLLPVVDALTLEQLLTAIGGVGIAVNVIKAQYPDPWQVRIKNVFLGLSVSENDLCQMLLHSDNAPIEYPGRPGETYNAVLPIRSGNPAAYDVYQKSFRIFADLHASFALRGALACVPADKLALQCAVMLKLIRQVGPFAPGTELELKTIKSLRMQIAQDFMRYSVADLASNLARDDPRPYLSGGDGVSSILKPIVVIIAAADCAQLRADPSSLCRAIRAIFHFGFYQAARHAYRDGGREDAIKQLFGIDMDESRRRSDVGAPFEPDGEFNGILPVDYEAAFASTLSWGPDLNDFMAYIRFGFGGSPVAPDILGDLKVLGLGAVVEALLCEKEEDRIDVPNRIAKGPTPGDLDSIIAYGNAYCAKVYHDDYNKRLAEKRTMEASLRLEHLVKNLGLVSDLATFISLLTGIPNRSAPGYKELQGLLMDLSTDVPLRDMKLFTIITGRDIHGDPVWADGNIFIGNFTPFVEIFKDLDPTGDMWQRINVLQKKYGVYRYSRSWSNRHGHGNDKPSYWALGYLSLEAFRVEVSAEEYEAYAKLHCDCCGFKRK